MQMSGRNSGNSGNRTNQCNPTHQPTGPGHQAGYHGTGTTPDLNNHGNQMNSNNSAYQQSRGTQK